MKYDPIRSIAIFESTGREVYCHGEFSLENGNDRGISNAVCVSYGSDGSEDLTRSEALEVVEDIIAKAIRFREWIRSLNIIRRSYREQFVCKVCGNIPDEAGELNHGRGCYTQSPDGGGSEFIEFPQSDCRCRIANGVRVLQVDCPMHE